VAMGVVSHGRAGWNQPQVTYYLTGLRAKGCMESNRVFTDKLNNAVGLWPKCGFAFKLPGYRPGGFSCPAFSLSTTRQMSAQ
jgi:hypothetical protein